MNQAVFQTSLQLQTKHSDDFQRIIGEVFPAQSIVYSHIHNEVVRSHFEVQIGGELEHADMSAVWALKLRVQHDRMIVASFTSPTFDFDLSIPALPKESTPLSFLVGVLQQTEVLDRRQRRQQEALCEIGYFNTRLARALLVVQERLRESHEEE